MDKEKILYEKIKDFVILTGHANHSMIAKNFKISISDSYNYLHQLRFDDIIMFYYAFGLYLTIVKKKYKLKKDKSKVIVNKINPLILTINFIIWARKALVNIFDRYYTRHSLIYQRAIFVFINEEEVYLYYLISGLRIKYQYARRLMDLMEEDRIISAPDPKTGKQDLLISKEDFFNKIENMIF